MRKSTDIRRSFIRYAAVATVLTVVFLFVKKDNLVSWAEAGFTLHRQERRIEELDRQNRELDRRMDALSSSRDTLEKFAREEFFFAAEGDDVYIVE